MELGCTQPDVVDMGDALADSRSTGGGGLVPGAFWVVPGALGVCRAGACGLAIACSACSTSRMSCMPGPCCIELDACCALAGGPDLPGTSNPGGGALGPSTVPTGVEYCDA
eukprot:3714363-Alexandrium_andersonii.AAC.1